MTKARLLITLEFNKNSREEVAMYNLIRSYSSAQGIIKDVLKGKLPVSLVQPKIVKLTKNEEQTYD